VVVVVIVAMDMAPAHGCMRPVMTGANELWAGMRIDDMAPTLKAMLHCSQQMHLKPVFREPLQSQLIDRAGKAIYLPLMNR
jgi:hypothetical protein